MTIGKKRNMSTSEQLQAKYGRLTFASILRSNRKCEEMSQTKASKMLGISKQYLSDLENGRRFPSLEFAEMAAKKFGDSPSSWQRYLKKDIELAANKNQDIKIPATQLLSMLKTIKK